ncbi:MAG: hypothetical protein ACI8XO_002720, partial [Verrucomicrobiales bacterium]
SPPKSEIPSKKNRETEPKPRRHENSYLSLRISR